MGKYRAWVGVLGISWLSVQGCGQELVLPSSPGAAEEQKPGPSDGITGAAGAFDEAVPAARLPVPGEPSYTPFGGAGGDAAGGEVGSSGAGDTAPHTEGGAPAVGMGSGGAATPDQAGAGGAAFPDDVPTEPPVLFFTEYVEGTGSLKALEIYSLGATSLEGCELRTYFNGKLEPARLALHGTLPAGGFQVLCSSGLASAQPALCDRSTNLTFNGDDALALVCDGTTLDVFGQVGVDPGEAWGEGSTADHTLRRRCEVLTGHHDGSAPFDPASEWLALPADTFDDLGQHACGGAPRPQPEPPSASP